MRATRRQILLGAAGIGLGLAGLDRLLESPAEAAVLPSDPSASGIEHVVVLMMENRSFDHVLGWLPGADGKQAGLTFTDRYGVRHGTHHLTRFDSCGYDDPDHSREGGQIQYNHGRCDGWLRSGNGSDTLPIGYYTKADLPFLGRAAADWTTFDRYFSPVMAETYPNRFYLHAAQTDRLHNSTAQARMTTIWDRLKDAGVSGTYYFSDVPFTALWRDKHLDISKPFANFLADAAAGTLPAVAFVDPRFQDEASGTSNDDHPHADIRAGEAFLNQVYDAVRTSPAWKSTVFIITFDEWGGFFDHVPPGHAPDVRGSVQRGFRVPTVLISPFARRGYVGHQTYDHTSILRMITWRWGLEPLTPRDAAARNIAEVLDLAHPDTAAPTYSVPSFTATACTAPQSPTAESAEEAEWPALKNLATQLGWSLPL